MEIHEDEHPVSLQLFGSEPEIIQQAVEMIKDRPYDILDVNMGCPVPKVVGNGEGSALMKNPELILGSSFEFSFEMLDLHDKNVLRSDYYDVAFHFLVDSNVSKDVILVG